GAVPNHVGSADASHVGDHCSRLGVHDHDDRRQTVGSAIGLAAEGEILVGSEHQSVGTAVVDREHLHQLARPRVDDGNAALCHLLVKLRQGHIEHAVGGVV